MKHLIRKQYLNRLTKAGCALLLSAALLAGPASAAGALSINGVEMGPEAMATICGSTTYVSLRAVAAALDCGAAVSWEDGAACVRASELFLTARPGSSYLTVNGESVYVPNGVMAAQGRVLVPIRPLAQAFGAAVYWSPVTGDVTVTSLAECVSAQLDSDDLYWLSRIISAESQGESLEGKIAVGNVVLNRVASPEFPDTIYDVVFDSRWGGQFEPVRNGTIYNTPTEESILAAKLCLAGANTVGDSLYFLAPSLAQNLWTAQNREYVATIGNHDFYL